MESPQLVERLSAEVKSLRHALASADMEEEAHVNRLLHACSTLRKEKREIALSIERESESVLHRLSASVRSALQERDEARARAQAAGSARVRACCAAWEAAMQGAMAEAAGAVPQAALARLQAAVQATLQQQLQQAAAEDEAAAAAAVEGSGGGGGGGGSSGARPQTAEGARGR